MLLKILQYEAPLRVQTHIYPRCPHCAATCGNPYMRRHGLWNSPGKLAVYCPDQVWILAYIGYWGQKVLPGSVVNSRQRRHTRTNATCTNAAKYVSFIVCAGAGKTLTCACQKSHRGTLSWRVEGLVYILILATRYFPGLLLTSVRVTLSIY